MQSTSPYLQWKAKWSSYDRPDWTGLSKEEITKVEKQEMVKQRDCKVYHKWVKSKKRQKSYRANPDDYDTFDKFCIADYIYYYDNVRNYAKRYPWIDPWSHHVHNELTDVIPMWWALHQQEFNGFTEETMRLKHGYCPFTGKRLPVEDPLHLLKLDDLKE